MHQMCLQYWPVADGNRNNRMATAVRIGVCITQPPQVQGQCDGPVPPAVVSLMSGERKPGQCVIALADKFINDNMQSRPDIWFDNLYFIRTDTTFDGVSSLMTFFTDQLDYPEGAARWLTDVTFDGNGVASGLRMQGDNGKLYAEGASLYLFKCSAM